MSEYAHCLNYKIAFKHEDFSQVKLFEEVGGKFEKCVVFTDTFGFEGLLYVEERFREVAKQLEYDGEQCFINFPKVLQGTALSNWKILVRGIHPDFQTLNDFNTQIKTFYRDYCDDNARDSMYEYLKKCKKPIDEEPRVHVRRLTLLYYYSSKLPGFESVLNAEQMKRAIFHTFPDAWQKQYLVSNCKIQDQSLMDVVAYMQTIKAYADQERNKKRGAEEGQGEGRKKKPRWDPNRGRNQSGKVQPNDPCPFHNGHKWIDCFDNQRGHNFRPRSYRPVGNNIRAVGGAGRNQHNQVNTPFHANARRGGNGGRPVAYQGRGGRESNGQDHYVPQQQNAYHFERKRDQSRRQTEARGVAASNRNNQRDDVVEEQHYFDRIGENMFDQE